MGSEHELTREGSVFATVLACVIRCLGTYINIRCRILQAINTCKNEVGVNLTSR
jgi:hypothetical protein